MTKSAFWICLGVLFLGHLVWSSLSGSLRRSQSPKSRVLTALEGFDSGGRTLLDEMFREGMSPNAGTDGRENSGAQSMLDFAIRSHNVFLIDFLLDHGADPKLLKRDLFLEGSVLSPYGEAILQKLVDKGLDIKLLNQAFESPLIYIAANYYGWDDRRKLEDPTKVPHGLHRSAAARKVEWFINHGIDVNGLSFANYTALHEAVKAPANLDLVAVLIKAGANVNAQNKYGLTPLMIAADNCEVEAVKMLVRAGADIKLKDNDGRTALDRAGDIKRMLIEAGAQR